MRATESHADREARLNRQARRAAAAANAAYDRARAAYAAGKIDLYEYRDAQRDAHYWNQIVNSINGYI